MTFLETFEFKFYFLLIQLHDLLLIYIKIDVCVKFFNFKRLIIKNIYKIYN